MSVVLVGLLGTLAFAQPLPAEALNERGWTAKDMAQTFDSCMLNAKDADYVYEPGANDRDLVSCMCMTSTQAQHLPRTIVDDPEAPIDEAVVKRAVAASMQCMTFSASAKQVDLAKKYRYGLEHGVLLQAPNTLGWTAERQVAHYEACLQTHGEMAREACFCELSALASTVPWSERESADPRWTQTRSVMSEQCMAAGEDGGPFLAPWQRGEPQVAAPAQVPPPAAPASPAEAQ
jgi:hypothetical protein